MLYVYDFGLSWRHWIEYEKILFKTEKQKYPLCIYGERKGPPEDCGGIYGYTNFLKIINDPSQKEYKSMRAWAGNKCDTEDFDSSKVRFENPQRHFKKCFC